MSMENWKDIIGYEGLYLVSDCGRIMSLPRTWVTGSNTILSHNGCILKQCNLIHGYKGVVLNNGKSKTFRVHRLVAMAFIENPENKKEVNHLDGNKANNIVENLEWATASENQFHSLKTGLRNDQKKVIDIETGAHYYSISEAARVNKINDSYLTKMLSGKRKNVTTLKLA